MDFQIAPSLFYWLQLPAYTDAMPEITESQIACPYCGESISVLVDDSQPEQSYVEDCQVCCRPIVMDVAVDLDGDVTVSARSENE